MEHLIPLVAQEKSPQKLAGTYGELDVMLRHGVLTDAQHKRVETELLKMAPRPSLPSGGSAPAPDRIGQLKTLAELRDSGALTQEEFETEKARLLAP
jgi:Short C-terminal domain